MNSSSIFSRVINGLLITMSICLCVWAVFSYIKPNDRNNNENSFPTKPTLNNDELETNGFKRIFNL